MRRVAFAFGVLLSLQGLSADALPVDTTGGAACQPAAFEGDGFTVCRYDPAADELRLAWRDKTGPLGSLLALKTALGPDAKRVVFAMNAGMYDPSRRPVGLWVAAGETLRPLNVAAGGGNFFLKPNGVFWVGADGAPHVEETEAFAATKPAAMWATQSGPLLVRAGALHPAISANGPSLAVRNGVGVKGGEALFVISDRPASLGRLARFLRDGLGCPDALYFDGAVSSLWAPALGRRDGRAGLGTFVVVLRKP